LNNDFLMSFLVPDDRSINKNIKDISSLSMPKGCNKGGQYRRN
jgi:hypothetical protein